MLRIVNFFWQLCLFRTSPAHLPSAWFVAVSVFTIYLIISLGVVALARSDLTGTGVVVTVAVGIILQAAVTCALLQFKGYLSRFSATWSALLGTNAVILIIVLPFYVILMQLENPMLITFVNSITLVCVCWWLAIAGHIYHKAVDISVVQGLCIAFVIELLGVVTSARLVSG